MAIPDFQALMLPLIELCRDRKEHVAKELVSSLAEQFGLTEEERMQPLPSGGAPFCESGWMGTLTPKNGANPRESQKGRVQADG